MKPYLRRTLLLFLVYAVLVALSLTFARRRLDAQTRELMTHTAELIGVEVARSVETEAGRAVDRAGSLGRVAVVERVIEIIDASKAVRAASFVGPDGEILASGRVGEIGQRSVASSELFGESKEPRLTAIESGGFAPRAYALEIPLLEGEELRGHFRIELSTAEFAPFYRQLHSQALQLAAAGFLSLGLLAFLLHLQMRRTEDVVVRGLERLMGDEPPGSSETTVRMARELPRAREAVDSVARALGESRREREAGDRRWKETVERIDVGLIGIASEGTRWANRRALELLELGEGPATPDEAARMVLAALERDTDPDEVEAEARVVEVRTAGPLGPRERRLRVEVENLGSERLLFLQDQDALDALAVDLRHATRLRSLMHLYLGVAHDLKAPVNSMLMNLQLARRRVERLGPSEGTPELSRDLEIVEKELGRLHRSLERLLSQTAPETEERRPCDLVLVLREIEELLAPQARQQKIELDFALPDRPVLVDGHRDRLEQAILGIAINGLEAIGVDGRLEFELRADESSATLAVRDDGPGIPAALLPRIFDMRMTTKAQGNGIGLFVARSILEEEHGGRVEVRSTSGEGATFSISLPTTRGEVAATV